jgi:outer membrane protein
MPPSVPKDLPPLVTQAVASRPDVAKLRFERDAAYKFAAAENDLNRPVVSAVGTAGFLPYFDAGSPTRPPEHYEGAAVNVDIPIFNGGLFGARRAVADFRAKQSEQDLRDGEQQIARDVRVAWGNVTTAFERLDVTEKFMQSATLALDLAQGRYTLGLASIVELTQAQLNLTRAEVEHLNAKYAYQMEYATLEHALGSLR